MNKDEIVFAEYKRHFINDVLDSMSGFLNNAQMTALNKSLNHHTDNLNIKDNPKTDMECDATNEELIKNFTAEKTLQGCSERTVNYYFTTLKNFSEWSIKSLTELTTDDVKEYFRFYKNLNDCSNSTVDNVRRVLSSFYNYLIESEYIIDTPMRKLPAIKKKKTVKEPFSAEEITLLRNIIVFDEKSKDKKRNLAIFELLLSSGMRIGECNRLNRTSVDLSTNSFIVSGKGNKQRTCYMNSAAKIALENYLDSREDDNIALFVSSKKPHNRLSISAIERMIREYGERAGVNAHPHKFRRTFATNALRKGAPLEEVSKFLGHSNVDTTLIYAIVDQDELKINHEKYMEF